MATIKLTDGNLLIRDGSVCLTCCDGLEPELCPVYEPSACSGHCTPGGTTVPAGGYQMRVFVRGYARRTGTLSDDTPYSFQGLVDWSADRMETGCARERSWATAPYNGGSDPATQPRITLVQLSGPSFFPGFIYLAFRHHAGLSLSGSNAIASWSGTGGAALGAGTLDGASLNVDHADTTASVVGSDTYRTMDRSLLVAWSAQAVPGRRVSRLVYEYYFTSVSETPGDDTSVALRIRYEVLLHGPILLDCEDGAQAICDPDPEFDPAPEWYEEPVDPPCDPGCTLGPLWYRELVTGVGVPTLPDQATHLSRGGTWACGRLVSFPCPSGSVLYLFVPCAYPIGLLNPGLFCDPATPIICPEGCSLSPGDAVLLDGVWVSACYYLWVLENIDLPGDPPPLPEGCVMTPDEECLSDEIDVHVCNTADGPINLSYRVPCGFTGSTPQWVLDLCTAIQGVISPP